jgi:hypothetical protein
VELFLTQQLPTGVPESAADLGRRADLRLTIGPTPLRGGFALSLRSAVPTTLGPVELCDPSGRRVAGRDAETGAPRSVHELTWDAGLPAGVYLLRATARDARERAWNAAGRVVWLGR